MEAPAPRQTAGSAEHETKCRPKSLSQRVWWRFLHWPALAVVAVYLIFDFVPRFYQGDSLSYVTTNADGWLPPDRSWQFGLLVNWLLRHTHGLNAYILIQAALLAGLAAALPIFFRDGRHWRVACAIAVFAMCLDPVIEIYVRFLMSDFLSFIFFMAALLAAFVLLRPDVPRTATSWAFPLMAVATIAAVFTRIVYAMIIEGTLVLTFLVAGWHMSWHRRARFACAATLPVLAICLMAASNAMVFAKRFPNEIFVTKLSGDFLAGVFAPALQPVDFARAGVPVTAKQFQSLDLANYGKRLAQVWGSDPDDLHHFLRERLGAQDDYAATLDKTCMRLVKSAFLRDPLAFLAVYLEGAREYLEPSQWIKRLDDEMGINSPLPDGFVAYVNQYAVTKLYPGITVAKTPLLRIYTAVAFLYPLQIVLGLAAALYCMLFQRRHFGLVLLSAALIVDLALAPVYSNYVIARYILAAIALNYVLIAMVVAALLFALRRGIAARLRQPWGIAAITRLGEALHLLAAAPATSCRQACGGRSAARQRVTTRTGEPSR
jgi:hypothetical protein